MQPLGAYIWCPNSSCPDQVRGRVLQLVSRAAFDITGLGTKKVDTAKVNAKGVAKLAYTAKKVGKNKLTAIYKGDGYTNGSKDKLTVKVTR